MELVFKVIVVFTVIQRISELFLAKSNEKFIIAKGGKVLPEKNYLFMVLLHTSWLIIILYYSFFASLTFTSTPFAIFLVLFLVGQSFRIIAIKTLGRRWSTRVMILPEAPAINSGLFNYLRHPNYVGVIIEIAALPLMAGLWQLAVIFSLINGVILFFRIRFEEDMLIKYCDYENRLINRKA
jgi:methyltransferase